MSIGKDKEEPSVMDAVDNLSNMAEIDLKTPLEPEMEEDGEPSDVINWRDPRQALRNEGALRETFRVLHRYLQNIVRKDRTSLADSQIQKGIHAIMILATEAVQKMDRFTALYPDQYKPISKLKEYEDLQKYYLQHILSQLPQPKETPEAWEEELKEEGGETIEAQKKGLRDLEAVRKDQNYELFFIKNEHDRSYFGRNLLRHIRLVGNFDELISKTEGEDPLLKIRELFDREMHEGAKEVLRLAAPFLDEFYKEGMQHKDHPYVGSLNKAIMALRMSANPKNLIENQSFKSCLEYYSDFHRFLRAALQTPEYKEYIEEQEKLSSFSHSLLLLSHALCCFYFMRIEPKKEALKLIHQIMIRGGEMRGVRSRPRAEEKKLQLWTDAIENDDNLRFLLKHYPNGPILRTLDAFREEEEYEGFDPLTHFNFPSEVFSFLSNDLHLSVLRLPCPIKQIYINKAEIVEEFQGFLRYYAHELKADRHLIVNIQDRTSWDEFARCSALEECAKKAEFSQTLFVCGLSKSGDFYLQQNEYQVLGGAPIFMEQFKQQILSRGDCGYYFPETIKLKNIEDFINSAFHIIHSLFFEKKETLTIQERGCFIEIFYLLFILKMVEWTKCDSISFTCKDGIDTGTAQTAILYGFLRILSNPEPWKEEEEDFLLWVFYSPALLVRDRAIQASRFQRAIFTLKQVHTKCLKNNDQIIKELNNLFTYLKFPFQINIPQ